MLEIMKVGRGSLPGYSLDAWLSMVFSGDLGPNPEEGTRKMRLVGLTTSPKGIQSHRLAQLTGCAQERLGSRRQGAGYRSGWKCMNRIV